MSKQEDTELSQQMTNILEGKKDDPFYFYEPWEPEPFEREEYSKGFQTSFHQSTAKLRIVIAGNRIGKSMCEAVEAIIAMTGEVPYSMRYEKGHKTDIPRLWKDEGPESPGALARIRFGFIESKTDTWHPPRKYPDMPRPEWPKEAPCGYIEGAGVYPPEKISKRTGDRWWICTYKQARDDRWVPFMSYYIPSQYLNTEYTLDGYSVRDQRFKLTNRNSICFITYEQGPERVQSAGVFGISLDEEPKLRKFYTECDQRLMVGGSEGFMTMGFTPLLGLSWSYQDVFKPCVDGLLDEVEIYHATQYNSPYLSEDAVNSRAKRYKPYEVQARVYGRYSEMKGRPYYDFEKLCGIEGKSGWIDTFIGGSKKKIIRPIVPLDEWNVEAFKNMKVVSETATFEDENVAWEIYEDNVHPEGAYFISVDTAEGAENEEDAVDRNAAFVHRLPIEEKGENPEWPVFVAALTSKMEVLPFARQVIYGAVYYNYATLVNEITGETGATFMSEVRDWPFFYRSVVLHDVTRKMRNKRGFETSAKTRTAVWDMVGDFINSHDKPGCMKNFLLLKECSQAIYGKRGRPDHPDGGTSDCITAKGIALYVYKHGREQFHCNKHFHSDMAMKVKKGPQTIFERYGQLENNPKKNGFLGKNRKKTGENSYVLSF